VCVPHPSCISTFYNCTTVFILFQDGRMVHLSCICTIAPILHHMYFKRKLRIVFEVVHKGVQNLFFFFLKYILYKIHLP
jgi:hypothetical protein